MTKGAVFILFRQSQYISEDLTGQHVLGLQLVRNSKQNLGWGSKFGKVTRFGYIAFSALKSPPLEIRVSIFWNMEVTLSMGD